MQRCQPWGHSLLVAITLWALSTAALRAQTTVSVSGAPPATTTVVAPVAPPPAGFFGGLSGCCASCKAKLKASPACALIKNALKPLSALTGGLICGGPVPGPGVPGAPGAGPPPPACAAEAKIKADAAQAAARRDAVRFLGTVDCHWFPEAEAALIASLRCDRSECVRMEAALALGRGCCCTKNTVEALRIAASGTSRDGNPGERCPRVRWAALEALQTCLCNCGEGLPDAPYNDRPENPPEPLAPGEASPDDSRANLQLQPYYARLAELPASDVLRDARATLANLGPRPSITPEAEAPAANQGEGLVGLWRGTRPAAPSSPTADAVAPRPTVVAQPRPVNVQLQRLPATNEPHPEPIYLSRPLNGSVYR